MQKRKVGQRRVEQCMELLVAKLTNNNEKELALAQIVIYSLYKMTQLQGIEGKTKQRKCVLGMKNCMYNSGCLCAISCLETNV